MKFEVLRDYKSLKRGDLANVELPAFTVVTGANGSGKSNLLEAIKQGLVMVDGGGISTDDFHLFQLGELMLRAEDPVTTENFPQPWISTYNKIFDIVRQYGSQTPNLDEILRSQLVEATRYLTPAAWELLASQGKPVHQLTVDEVAKVHPLLPGVQDIFSTSLASIFLTYSNIKYRNLIAQFEGNESALSNDDLQARYGPPPWQVLNDTLQIMGMPYSFSAPPSGMDGVQYEVNLTGPDGLVLKPSELSSGERVLLAVATGMFTGSRIAESIHTPYLLLLDEADASLHPSMIKNLLTIIQDIFVTQFGVRVILTTHSPSTVALAPESALYVMSRAGERLRKTSTDSAIKALTAGISSLSVKIENRRQVFVESEYDQQYFQDLFALAKSRLDTEESLEFIAVGRRDKGGGCDAVKRLVKDLRDSGIDTVSGIVDRDNRGGTPDYVKYISDRYSIENLVLDPVLLGTFLLREQIVSAADLGLPDDLRHFELNADHAVPIADALSTRIGLGGERRAVDYVGGFTTELPAEWLDLRGHDLEGKVVATFPQLNSFKKNLIRDIIKRSAGDRPEFIPMALVCLFEELIGPGPN